jgi:hypothetical protein
MAEELLILAIAVIERTGGAARACAAMRSFWSLSMVYIRIEEDQATRLIARHLREAKIVSSEANALATKIVEGLRYAETTRKKPGLKDWRMIPRHPSPLIVSKILNNNDFNLDQQRILWLWDLFYEEGSNPPDDIDMTNL